PTATMGGLLGLLVGPDAVESAFAGQTLSDRYVWSTTRDALTDHLPGDPDAEDTFTLMAQRMLGIVDKAVVAGGGTVDLVNNQWVLPEADLSRALDDSPTQRIYRKSLNNMARLDGVTVTAGTSVAAASSTSGRFADGYEHDFSGREFSFSGAAPVFSTAAGASPGAEQEIWVTYGDTYEIEAVRFIEGAIDPDGKGGWFESLALYVLVNGQWQEVLDRVDVLVTESEDELPPHSLLRQEALLWRAISRARLAEEGQEGSPRSSWADEIRSLFADYPATVMHARVWLFLLFSDFHRNFFSEQELRFFQAKQSLAEGGFTEASTAFAEAAAARESRELLLLPYGVFDYFRAAAASGSTSVQFEAAAILESLSEDVDSSITARTLEYAGRLYRATSRFPQAIRALEQALEAVVPGESDQRIQWYLLSSRVRENSKQVAQTVGGLVATLEQPAYYADVLSELGERLIADADWARLLQAYQGIEEFATPGTLARYQLVLGRVYEQRLLPATETRARELRTRYLERAADQSEDRFSSIIAGTLLGVDAVESLGIEPDQTPRSEQDVGAADALARTYLSYGLRDRLLAHLAASGSAVSPAVALEVARELSDAAEYRSSVVALNFYDRSGGAFDRAAAELRYPRAFAALVEQAAVQEGVDPWLLYALAREESLFDPEVVSVAGAVGLTQLLPSTAEEIARRMQLEEEPVLTDPGQNVAIGARYFSTLTEQFGTPARAIAAYNGGQGNVRRWERSTPLLDELLFHQLIPFDETYNHVRKVVVSTAYYGYLYGDRTPAETVAMIFDLSLE
ncbi:MAG: flagellar assembly lytic transglycosylase, partial [Spirochaetales bacterium]